MNKQQFLLLSIAAVIISLGMYITYSLKSEPKVQKENYNLKVVIDFDYDKIFIDGNAYVNEIFQIHRVKNMDKEVWVYTNPDNFIVFSSNLNEIVLNDIFYVCETEFTNGNNVKFICNETKFTNTANRL